jgi:hypothetical protein
MLRTTRSIPEFFPDAQVCDASTKIRVGNLVESAFRRLDGIISYSFVNIQICPVDRQEWVADGRMAEMGQLSQDR